MIKKTIGLRVLVLPLALAFVVMLSVFYVKPAVSDMTNARKKMTADKQELADLQSQNAKLSALKAKWEAMDKKRVQIALPENQSTEDYMAELYGRVSRSGALMESFLSQSAAISHLAYVCGAVAAVPTAVSPASSSAASAGTAALPETAPGTPGLPAASVLCTNSASVKITVKGSWDQLLGLLKYLEYTNRIVNITGVSISSSSSQEESGNGDLLKSDVTLQVFYKPKSETGNSSSIANLTSRGDFNKKILGIIEGDKIISSTYEEPLVSEDGERNIFK